MNSDLRDLIQELALQSIQMLIILFLEDQGLWRLSIYQLTVDRICLGMYFALAEASIFLSLLVQDYEFLVPPGVTKEELLHTSVVITARPTNGMRLIVRKREKMW